MPHARIVLTSAALAAAVGLTLGGCAAAGRPGGTSASDQSASDDGGELAGDLRIFAAASLAAAFDELAARFEQRHPAVDVLPIAYDGSATLATQLIEGAPADVFAAADERTMQQVVDAGLAAAPVLFAGNTLVIAVPRDNPGGVKTIEDLGWSDTTVVLCAPQVPCGAATETLLADNGVSVTPVSLEQNVTAVLTKIAAGEADAGLVYATDARASDEVRAVPAAGAERVVNRYPIAAMREAANAAAAEAFVAYVRSDEAQALLASLGFASP
ncbi:molybdate ABC transporter substrate-binding protein [Microbacterium sp. CFH 90308]|uniref:Molybdate ABC transporter substrate-binding protein n=1 Tax=Microbacterium salsuginis TaxID=2722803 RepID=A0ABX1KA71_9MICO|nr:molybdate ABC transporter substrate-binding protein [Microbacterium sp. CFH 90308]NLP82883.1 molybdate ABC transporter substrate-binding protein [Microbacterium sp. CFH 90308]